MQCENIGKFAATENEMIATAVQPNNSEENRDENVDKWMQVDFKTTSSSSSSSSSATAAAAAAAAANFSQPERLPERQEEHSTLGGPRLQSQIPLTLTTPTSTTTTTSTPSMGRSANFPNRVYEMLEYVTMIQQHHHHQHQHQRIHKRASSSLPIEATIVAWTIDGAAFDIYQPNDLFVQHLGSKFFPHQSKFRAFVRQLHCWGFQRIPFDPVTATQAHAAATTAVHRYCHFYFHRYQPQWKRFIQRYNCPKPTTNHNSSSNNKQFQQQQQQRQQQLQSRLDSRLFLALPSNNHNVVSSPPINDKIIVIPMRLQRRMSPLSLSSSILLLPHAMGHGHKTQQQYQIQPYLQSQQDRLGSASTHS